jgi:hypothetical protein
MCNAQQLLPDLAGDGVGDPDWGAVLSWVHGTMEIGVGFAVLERDMTTPDAQCEDFRIILAQRLLAGCHY